MNNNEILIKAMNNPRVNVFDIIESKQTQYGFTVHTYPKPGETSDEYHERDTKNHQKAFELKTKKP